ncbi:MAG: single-stranded DNA-binding protein [Bacilli bacterium]|nr:single-stranded DNA-binding protein [Bacilli bacterium]
MNKVFLIGRLTRDPELRYTTSNIPTASFSIAVNRNFTNQSGEREADFINIVVWRKQAENVKNFITKGSQVAIDGRIQTRSYDGEDGKKRYVTEVVADNVQFLDSKGSNQNFSSEQVSPYDMIQSEPKGNDMKENPYADFGSNIEISDDDLPF